MLLSQVAKQIMLFCNIPKCFSAIIPKTSESYYYLDQFFT